MKILSLTNLFPCLKNPLSGIFITKRLDQYKKLGIDYVAVPVWFQDDLFVRLAKYLLRKSSFIPATNVGGVDYSPLKCRRTVRWLLWEVLRRISEIFDERAISIYSQRFAEYVEKHLDLSTFDLIHAHGMYTPPAGLIAQILSQKYSKPYVLTVHGSDVNILMEKRKKIYLGVFESAQAVIFVSKALLEKARSFGYSGRNAVIIPNGYDPQIFKPLDKGQARRQLGIHSEGYKYVGFVGNLIEIKRADKLVEIFEKVRDRIKKVRFIVVGDGHLRSKIEEEAKRKDLDVLFTGRVDQEKVAKYMNAMDVMILPSRNEGWPCVVLEAQACGTCVIGSSNVGIPEAIGFDEYVVAEGKDFEDRIAQRIVQVLEEGYDREKLIERAKDFTWERIVQMEKRIYEQVLKNVKHEFE